MKLSDNNDKFLFVVVFVFLWVKLYNNVTLDEKE